MEELARLAPARGAIVLSLDGLLLQARGCDTGRAERVATGLLDGTDFQMLALLRYQEGNVAVFTTTGLDQGHLAWVGLARLFQGALGSLSFGKPK